METIWNKRLEELTQHHLRRELRVLTRVDGVWGHTLTGRKRIFCSNDYLGLSNHPDLVAAAKQTMSEKGVGSAGSRLVCGNSDSHESLERAYADFVNKDAAVLFPSGYQANVGTLSALTGPSDIIFSDALCHASIIDGCRLSKSKVVVYEHGNVDDLEAKLAANPAPGGIQLIVTDAVFSMDGDVAPLADIFHLAKRFGALLYVDEAHSLGIVGPGGRGLCVQLGISTEVAIQVGTFGKAVGVCGAAVACSSTVSAILKSRARSLLYTTGAPPMLAEAIKAGLSITETADELRARLNGNIGLFRKLAGAVSLPLMASDTPIQPIVIGSSKKTMALSDALWERGFFVQGIRPPTVEEGTSRLRVTITVHHEEEDIQLFVKALDACMMEK